MAEAAPKTTQVPGEKAKGQEEILATYKALGDDHPTVMELREAIARKQEEQVQKLTEQLDSLVEKKCPSPKVENTPRPRFLIWTIIWITIFTGLFTVLAFVYITKQAKAISARNPVVYRTARIEVSRLLGGPTADQATDLIIREIEAIDPDSIIFAGNSLYKGELVKYLSERTRKGGTVVLLLGKGSPLLTRDASTLGDYDFSYVMSAPIPLTTQVLAAFNADKGRAVAFVGTFPFDRTQAESTENVLVEVIDRDQCNKLLDGYQRLFSKSTVIRQFQKNR